MEIIEILYIVLIFFTTVIGTLLTIVLFKLIKILNVLMEVVEVYNRVKQIIDIYRQIPEIILDKAKEYIFGK